ncbi:MAG: Rieske (2Fe-2S) protein [Pirellulaceae bacterium]|nr:Rieske (2Fe-2S) protein [Pirellulaceae bacterium]
MTQTPHAENKEGPTGRRGFLAAMCGSALGLGLAALGAAGVLWTAAVARFFVPNTSNEPASRFRVGMPGEFPSGRVETRYKDLGIWVVGGRREGQPIVFALSTQCTHLGCITLWLDDRREFKCPCHGSGFTIEGINTEGPAPRPLERFAIRIADDGQLEVDTSRTFRRELGQWNHPDSYVVV